MSPAVLYDYMARVSEMAFRLRPYLAPAGWFDVPSWVFDYALTMAGYGRASRDGERSILLGYPVRVDARMDPDAVRYVTPAGGPD